MEVVEFQHVEKRAQFDVLSFFQVRSLCQQFVLFLKRENKYTSEIKCKNTIKKFEFYLKIPKNLLNPLKALKLL